MILSSSPVKSRSLWIDSTFSSNYPQLSGLLEVDVAIVGGGVTGLSAALLLKQAGLHVAVCERARVAANLTTGHLTEGGDARFYEIARSSGDEAARSLWEAGREAINTVNEFLERYRISCSFQWLPGFAFAENPHEASLLEQEAEILRRLDIPHLLRNKIPGPFGVRVALEFPNQAQLHPRRYLLGLAEAVSGQGSYVFERTRVTRILPGEVRTESALIKTRHILITSCEADFEGYFQTLRAQALRRRVIAVRTQEEHSLQGLFWDAQHLMRSQNVGGSPLLLISDQESPDEESTLTGRSFDHLEDYARSHFDIESIDYRWSGRIWRSADGLPHLSSHNRVHAAAAYGDHDLTLGTAAARQLVALVLQEQEPLKTLHPNVG